MWEKGIAAYIGLDHSPETIFSYLRLAHQHGYTRLFTSLHIPEADTKRVLSDFHRLFVEATNLGYAITADISPQALSLLGASLTDLASLKEVGLSAIRLDYGFAPEQIAAITRSSGLEVEINASTVTAAALDQICKAKANLTKIRACHNYYPRPETGLSFPLFAERSRLLRSYGIPVLAFIPSLSSPRGPLFAGLPTLEKHRLMSPQLAAKELLACQLVDGLLFGDPLAKESELAAVAALDSGSIELQVVVETDITSAEREILFTNAHTNRTDPGEWVIRSQEARHICKAVIPARTALSRQAGAVTIDNQEYLRYMGEMQLILSPLPADRRVNVAAHIVPEEVFLLSYIQPGGTFRLKEVIPT